MKGALAAREMELTGLQGLCFRFHTAMPFRVMADAGVPLGFGTTTHSL